MLSFDSVFKKDKQRFMLSRHSVLKIAINVIIFDTFTEVSEIYTVTFSALNNTQTVLLPL